MENHIGYILKRTQLAFRTRLNEALLRHELTTPQYACLNHLNQDSGLSNAELARRCFITPQTMHKILVGLEKKAFVSREPDPQNQRRQRTLLTAAGQQALQAAESTVDALEAQMLKAFSAEDILRFQTFLTTAHFNLEHADIETRP